MQNLSQDELFHTGGSALTSLLSQSQTPILAKFVAPHCSSCVTLKPILEHLVTENAGQIQLVEIDMTQDPELAMTHNIRSAPTLVVFKNSQELERVVGLKPKKKYSELVQRAIAN